MQARTTAVQLAGRCCSCCSCCRGSGEMHFSANFFSPPLCEKFAALKKKISPISSFPIEQLMSCNYELVPMFSCS